METLEKIEAYLEDRMSEDRRLAFESELAENEQLRNEFDEMKAVILGIRSAAAIAFAEQVGQWEKRLKNDQDHVEEAKIKQLFPGNTGAISSRQESSSRKIPYIYAIAAAVVVLLGLLFILRPQSLDANTLYAAHFERPSNPFTLMGGDTKSLQLQAFQAYEQSDFQEAISLYQQVLKDSPQNAQVLYLLGVTYMEDDQPKKAIEIFDKVISEDKIYDEKAQWYKALAWLKANDSEKAKIQLLDIVNSEQHDYKKEAEALLRKI